MAHLRSVCFLGLGLGVEQSEGVLERLDPLALNIFLRKISRCYGRFLDGYKCMLCTSEALHKCCKACV